MTLTITGLGSGLDTNSLISSLVSIQQQPITALQTRQRTVDQASTTISGFSTKLAALATAARALDTTAEFNPTAASSSDATSVSATTVGGASRGGYDIQVTRLAREQRTQSNTFASASTALGLSGTLSIAVGAGTPVSVAVSSGDTLADVASRISSSGARVSAAVIYDGSTYRMQVRGLDTGATNTVAFTEDPALQAGLGLSVGGNTYQTAQDAQFTVDNVTMTRTTNQVSDAAPGLTLNLLRTTAAPVRVTVSDDAAALKTKVQAFVTAYNDVVNASHTATGFGTQRASNTELAGDRVMRGSLDRLSRILNNNVPGTTGRYTTLASAGVSLQNDGTLRLNDATFTAALAADPASVAKLFVTDTASGATGVMGTFNSTVNDLTTSVNAPVRARTEALSAKSRRLGTEITGMQRRLDNYTESLRTQFASLEGVVGRYNSLLNTVGSLISSTNTTL
jgi:flagellar hook-associated protein 2